jgi:uncharacterized membrane protein (DUF441 family)
MIGDILKTLGETNMSMPSGEVVILLALLVMCLLTKASRTGLIVAYLFVFRWGWIFLRENFEYAEYATMFRGYVVLGILIPLLAALRMWLNPDT